MNPSDELGKIISKSKELKVIEYSFDDWFIHGVGVKYILSGKNSFKNEKEKYFFRIHYQEDTTLSYNIEHRISFEEAEKINEKRVELFDEAVNEIYTFLVSDFKSRFVESKKKDLLKAEITEWERIIFSNGENEIAISQNEMLICSNLKDNYNLFIRRNFWSKRYNEVNRQWRKSTYNKKKKYVLVSAIHNFLEFLNSFSERHDLINKDFFQSISETLNSKGFTKNCNTTILTIFFDNNFIDLDSKLNWISKRGSHKDRTPLFQLIAIFKTEWLHDSETIYERILRNVIYDNEIDELSKLKVSFTSWKSKYLMNPEIEIEKLTSLIPLLKTII